MPQLKRLLGDGCGEPCGAAEHLFTRPLHDVMQREQRRQAAALCAAPGLKMSMLLEDAKRLYANEPSGFHCGSLRAAPLDDCICEALRNAEIKKPSLFLVSSASLVAKGIRNVLPMDNTDGNGGLQTDILGQIVIQQTREIHVLLSILHDVQSCTQRPAQVFIGPFCHLFTPFLTTHGLTTTGEGLLRMVQLACRRVNATCEDTEVIIIQTTPLAG